MRNFINKSKNKSENDFLIGNGLNDDYDYINQENEIEELPRLRRKIHLLDSNGNNNLNEFNNNFTNERNNNLNESFPFSLEDDKSEEKIKIMKIYYSKFK